MVRKLNENFQNLVGNDVGNKSTSDSLLNFEKPKKLKRKSKIQIQQVIQEPLQQIKTVQSLNDLAYQNTIEQINKDKVEQIEQVKKEIVSDIIKTKTKKKKQEKILEPQKIQQQIIEEEPLDVEELEQITEIIEEENNISLENVDVEELVEDITEAISEIPNNTTTDVRDLEITPINKKDKTGYFKTKVNIKKDNIPQVINNVASYIKQQSNGIIKPRVVDLRVIGNTNKTQLRNSDLKLSAATVVFKPDHTKLKVNKGTRFMISIPEDFNSTGNLIVYLQESRAKTIIEISAKDFDSKERMVEFIGDRIAEYYYVGYDITLKKLQLRGISNPLMSVINIAVKTKDYKAKPYVDNENHIYQVDFKSNGDKNQWLLVSIRENKIQGYYNVYGVDTVSNTEFNLSTNKFTIQDLDERILEMLSISFNRDWKDQNIDETSIDYLIAKIKHTKLKNALLTIDDYDNEHPECGLEIQKVLSKLDMKKLQKNDYDAEAIIGKTNNLDFFILTYLAYQIIGGDKRKGRQYITSEDYYEKYSVNDRREYQDREKTILRKEGEQRNYNSRPYIFQLEYSVNGKVYIYRDKTFESVMENTNFLDEPKINVKSPIK